MRLAFWFQKFSRDELRRSPQAIANRGRWKNGDRQRSFRSAGVSWSPCGFACGNSKPVTTFPAGRRGFRGSIFSGRWKNGGCLVVPAGFWSAEIRSLSPHFQLGAGVVAHGCYSESEWRNRRC